MSTRVRFSVLSLFLVLSGLNEVQAGPLAARLAKFQNEPWVGELLFSPKSPHREKLGTIIQEHLLDVNMDPESNAGVRAVLVRELVERIRQLEDELALQNENLPQVFDELNRRLEWIANEAKEESSQDGGSPEKELSLARTLAKKAFSAPLGVKISFKTKDASDAVSENPKDLHALINPVQPSGPFSVPVSNVRIIPASEVHHLLPQVESAAFNLKIRIQDGRVVGPGGWSSPENGLTENLERIQKLLPSIKKHDMDGNALRDPLKAMRSRTLKELAEVCDHLRRSLRESKGPISQEKARELLVLQSSLWGVLGEGAKNAPDAQGPAIHLDSTVWNRDTAKSFFRLFHEINERAREFFSEGSPRGSTTDILLNVDGNLEVIGRI